MTKWLLCFVILVVRISSGEAQKVDKIIDNVEFID